MTSSCKHSILVATSAIAVVRLKMATKLPTKCLYPTLPKGQMNQYGGVGSDCDLNRRQAITGEIIDGGPW